MNLGNAIKTVRTLRRVTQQDLAKRAKLSAGYVSMVERNERDPTVGTVRRIATELNIPVAIIFFLATEPSEFSALDSNLAADLSRATLDFLRETRGDQPSLV